MKRAFILSLTFAASFCSCYQNGRSYEYKVVRMMGCLNTSFEEDNGSYKFADPTPVLNRMANEGWLLNYVYTQICTRFPNLSVTKNSVIGIRTNTKTQVVNLIFKRHKASNAISEPETEIVEYDIIPDLLNQLEKQD